MGEVVGAALVAHVPTIMLPEDVRLELNEGKEITLVPGLQRMKRDCIDRLQPDTVDRLRHALGVDVRAHRDRAGAAAGLVHEQRASARDATGPLRHAGRPRSREADRRAGQGPRRLLDPRVRRSVPADLLRHGEHLDLPRRSRHEMDQRRPEPDLRDGGLPVVGVADRSSDRARAIVGSCCWHRAG